MNPVLLLAAFACLFSFPLVAQQPVDSRAAGADLPSRIAFGSCSDHAKPQPILRHVVNAKPDLFVYLGDNIYGDTEDMAVLKQKYGQLGGKPEFQALRAAMPILSDVRTRLL